MAWYSTKLLDVGEGDISNPSISPAPKTIPHVQELSRQFEH